MPSMDVVSKIDVQAMDNAVNNLKREISSRYDFRNCVTEIEYVKKDKRIHILSGDDGKVKTITELLNGQLVKQKLDPKCLDPKDIEPTSHGQAKRDISIKEGISQDSTKKMVKFIKSLNLKVQAAIQDDQVRVSGKQIDDLQTVIAKLKEQDFGVPLQFVNLKRD